MKHIQECFFDTKPIVDYIKGLNHTDAEVVDEGLKDILKSVKDKLKSIASKVVEWAKGLVAQIKYWYMVVNDEGEILPCSTPMTAGNAWKNNLIDKSSTFVGLGAAAGKIVGTSESFENAKKMYPSTLDVWKKIAKKAGVRESKEEEFIKSLCESNSEEVNAMLNEVKLGNNDPKATYNVICDDSKLKMLVKARIKNPKLARLMIWGAPGIGKTAILNQVIDEVSAEQGKDYSLITKTLSNETPDNFFLPDYTENHEKATDIPKTWLPVWKPTGNAKTDAELDEKCGRGMLFIDELSRATQQVQNVILPLINEGVMNGWQLGSGWTIICASNRDEDEMNGGQSTIGNALGNRFAQVYYEPTCETWRKWADKQGFMSPLLTQWLNMPASETMAGGKYFYWDPNEEGDSEDTTHLMCTPRSWTNAMRELACYHHTGELEGFNIFDIDEGIIKMILNQYVPSNAVDAFWAYLKTIQSIGDFDAAVESVWKNNGAGLKINPKELIKVALPLAQLVICAHKDKLPTEKEFESLAEWVVKADNEQLASYVIDVFKNVFASNIPDSDGILKENDLKQYVFFLRKMNDTRPDVWGKIKTFDPFMDAWGVDRKTMPDYSKGIKIIADKYRAAFKSAMVGDKEGLG